MDTSYIYILILVVLLAIYLLNSRKNKSIRRDRKNRTFKKGYYERKKEEKKLKDE